MVSREAYFVIVAVIAIAGAYLFFTQIATPVCADVADCDVLECPEGFYVDCKEGRCACLQQEYEPPNF